MLLAGDEEEDDNHRDQDDCEACAFAGLLSLLLTGHWDMLSLL